MSWVDLFKLAFSVKCFKSCNCSSFFFGFGMDTYRWAEGFQSQWRRHLKRGCCFSCYFPLFLPSGEEQDYLGGKNFIGYKQMGFGLVAKTGYIGFGVGWEGKISHVQNVASVAGLGLFFFFQAYFPLPFSFKIGFAGLDLLGLD